MLPINEIMTRNVITVRSDTPIYEALNLLSKHQISGMPVVDEERYIKGMLSQKDVLNILIDDHLEVRNKVEDYMSRDVISFDSSADAIDVCKFFIRSPYRRVPVVERKKLVGIVSRRDIVELILEAKLKLSEFRYA